MRITGSLQSFIVVPLSVVLLVEHRAIVVLVLAARLVVGHRHLRASCCRHNCRMCPKVAPFGIEIRSSTAFCMIVRSLISQGSTRRALGAAAALDVEVAAPVAAASLASMGDTTR